jgi:starch synthase
MSILFGHPSGNPNSFHAALAHFEAGQLEAICVPWMPTISELEVLARMPGLARYAARLRRRHFAPLNRAEKVQGRLGEWVRMGKRLVGGSWADERLSYEANDWLMRVMRDECGRRDVTAVHAYEDCSLLQFQQAARTGKARIYDLPIGYYPAWESISEPLAGQFQQWLPSGYRTELPFVRPMQKRQEMELADLVLAPSSFVQRTVQRYADRKVAIAPYGVDAEFWSPGPGRSRDGPLQFLFAGQCSLRKGVPLLLEAWSSAALPDAELNLVGSWQLADAKLRELPLGVRFHGPVPPEILRGYFRNSDVLVLPSYFEGLALVVLEAMACGLPVIASDATGGADVVDASCGSIIPAGDPSALVEALRQTNADWQRWSDMRPAARRRAEAMTWGGYRKCVRAAVRPLLSGA